MGNEILMNTYRVRNFPTAQKRPLRTQECSIRKKFPNGRGYTGIAPDKNREPEPRIGGQHAIFSRTCVRTRELTPARDPSLSLSRSLFLLQFLLFAYKLVAAGIEFGRQATITRRKVYAIILCHIYLLLFDYPFPPHTCLCIHLSRFDWFPSPSLSPS